MITPASKKVTCPSCGHNEGVQILWGMPSLSAFEAEQRGEAVLGGSNFPPFFEITPNSHCLVCGIRWKGPDWTADDAA